MLMTSARQNCKPVQERDADEKWLGSQAGPTLALHLHHLYSYILQ